LEKSAPQYLDGPGKETCWKIARILAGKNAKNEVVDAKSKALKSY
jgi:hypothetical protein